MRVQSPSLGCSVTLGCLSGFLPTPCLGGVGWAGAVSEAVDLPPGNEGRCQQLRFAGSKQTCRADGPLCPLEKLSAPPRLAPSTLCPLSLISWTPWPSIRLAYRRAQGTRSQSCQLEIKGLLHGAGSSPDTCHFDYPLRRSG